MRTTATKAARRYCLACVGNQNLEVKSCTDLTCAFYPHRLGRPRVSVKTIRKFCLQCTNGSQDYVRECPSVTCQCYQYRMGKNPARVGIGKRAVQAGAGYLKAVDLSEGYKAKFGTSQTEYGLGKGFVP